MPSSEQEDDKIITCPSWCAGMQQIIELECIAEQLGISPSEAFRMALDEHIALYRSNEKIARIDIDE